MIEGAGGGARAGYKQRITVGDVIFLSEHRATGALASAGHRPRARRTVAARPRRAPGQATFFFDLASPWTYLAAERVDRRFAGLRWQPTPEAALQAGEAAADRGGEPARAAAEARAAALRMPLIWPERWPSTVPSAMRVAAMAAERGGAAPFVLAASRLAFCGGYDLDDPEILTEAAAAAGLGLDESLAAARDARRDGELRRAALCLGARGADRLPAVVVDRLLFCGEHRVAEAAAAAVTASATELRGRRPS